MPHLHLETTADVPENADIPDILEALCQEIARHPSVEPWSVRAYHTLRSVWFVGVGARPAFVHLTVFVLSGRDWAWKRSVGEGLLEVLKERFEMTLESDEASLTIDVREMDRDAYQRYPAG